MNYQIMLLVTMTVFVHLGFYMEMIYPYIIIYEKIAVWLVPTNTDKFSSLHDIILFSTRLQFSGFLLCYLIMLPLLCVPVIFSCAQMTEYFYHRFPTLLLKK